MCSVENPPKITLSTSYSCPWAHRSQIALKELGLEIETVIIDLSVRRTPEIPCHKSTRQFISEFLVDSYPPHLEKSSSEEGGAYRRAKINSFVDTYFTKVDVLLFAVSRPREDKEKEAGILVDAITKEIEPLLQDAVPFFGGSRRLTLAKIQTGSSLLPVLSFPKYNGLLPKSVVTDLQAKAPAFWKWANAVTEEESVTYIWNEKAVAEDTQQRLAKLRVAAAKGMSHCTLDEGTRV